jgi:nucleoside-diphosphate-sugar epimerase
MNTMAVLVTGANGFLGSNLVDQLLSSGLERGMASTAAWYRENGLL